ncbi:hypothetical protein HNQ59_001928 [Chitinivorax tropicus]|uniref:Uncharacterized protein n=1 Tax=Chitinivorax tropicus TaxID=714531 RepID=A0A840MNQ3_9PROT|nr:hypothetical protein [Chitinivorax tropicus]MBB5018637.1 hypothetical protein [Chitinivorax tropicus]
MSGPGTVAFSSSMRHVGQAASSSSSPSSWFDEAWSAAKQFVKGEYDGPAAMLLDVVLGMVPVVGQAIDARDIILGLIDIADQPDGYEAWFNFITALIGVVPGGGDAIKRALRTIRKGHAPASELLSMLRRLGRGNPEQAVLDMLDVSKLQPHIKTLTDTLKSNRLVEALDAHTRQRITTTVNNLQHSLNHQFSKFSAEVRGWLKKQPNNAAEPDYVSKSAPRQADKPNAKGGTASQSKEHSSVAHADRYNAFTAATSTLAQHSLYFKGVLGEHMADYWVVEQGWAAGWVAHDRGQDGRWTNQDPKAPRKLNDNGAMTPLWPLTTRGRGIDAVWRTNRQNGKPYAVIEAKAYTDPKTPLSAMLSDVQDKQEFEAYKQLTRDWKKQQPSSKGRSTKRGDKRLEQPTRQTPSTPPPRKPDPQVMQMSHVWIRDRLVKATGDPLALRDLLRNSKVMPYTRHVLLFSIEEIFEHTVAVFNWFKYLQGEGQAPKDSEHAIHKATCIFDDAKLDAEERRRKVARSEKAKRGST